MGGVAVSRISVFQRLLHREIRKRPNHRHGKHTNFPMSLFFSQKQNREKQKNKQNQISKEENMVVFCTILVKYGLSEVLEGNTCNAIWLFA